ncbi:UDP-glucuronic acid decarboxylase 4 [Rhynchospora pubera]|uniref:UDP-glucuronate decarboxylase n=1 Tax=Rhynchospora pubera TaxID=906938 RepID=A0AAV8C9N3_9POAL|nr:UDP-glucuronic acid decarboxylase 4 [Rhynchospora pubera]
MSSELIYRGLNSQQQEASSYSPKGQKRLPWLSRPIRYLLSEQRLLFALLGMFLTTLVFLLAPKSDAQVSDHADPLGYHAMSDLSSHGGSSLDLVHRSTYERTFVAGKIPLGLKRKGLRILVTGGAGFVGSHLVDRLIERGDSVIVVDNFFTGRKENVMHHYGNPNFEMIRHDVVEPILLEVDQIYHLACPASPVHYKFNPVKTIKTNVVGTLNMLGLAKRVGARFLLTSTSEVYGDPLQHPQVETYWGNVNPIGVRSCYDEGKRTAETLTMDYHRGANLEVRIARIFNTYGPRMCIDDGRVVSNFVAQALRKEPMTVYGDGKQTRSFQYVSDLVEGLMRLMEGEHVGPFNLGNPGEFTMLELAKVVQDTIDPNAKIEFRPNTEDDPHKRKPDISRAKEQLGWEPKIPLRQGLPLMVNDFRTRIFGDHGSSESGKTRAGSS